MRSKGHEAGLGTQACHVRRWVQITFLGSDPLALWVAKLSGRLATTRAGYLTEYKVTVCGEASSADVTPARVESVVGNFHRLHESRLVMPFLS